MHSTLSKFLQRRQTWSGVLESLSVRDIKLRCLDAKQLERKIVRVRVVVKVVVIVKDFTKGVTYVYIYIGW